MVDKRLKKTITKKTKKASVGKFFHVSLYLYEYYFCRFYVTEYYVCKQLSLLCPSNISQWHFTSLGIFIIKRQEENKEDFRVSIELILYVLFKYVCHLISDPLV